MKYYRLRKDFINHKDCCWYKGTKLFKDGFGNLKDEWGNFLFRYDSEYAREYSIGNDDGEWDKRADLVDEIKTMCNNKDNHNPSFDSIYDYLWKYWRKFSFMKDTGDSWIFNTDFYCAPIWELEKMKTDLICVSVNV